MGEELTMVRPDGADLARVLLFARSDRLRLMSALATRFGDCVQFSIGRTSVVLLNSAEGAAHVLSVAPHRYGKGIGLRQAKRVLGEGLLTAEGSRWRAQRAAVAPQLRPASVAKVQDAFAAGAQRLALRWAAANGPFDVLPDLTSLTLANLGHMLFGRAIPARHDLLQGFEDTQAAAMAELLSLPLVHGAASRRVTRRAQQARRALADAVTTLVAQSPGGSGFGEVFSRRLAQPQDREQALDELVTLCLAGHETTAATLGWALHELSRHPQWQEIEDVELERGTGPSLSAVVNETLRLHPPVWLIPRQAWLWDEVGGMRITPGTDVVICPYTLHRHPRYWDRPDAFAPDRFLDGRAAGSPAYLPFGAGQRGCVGSHLAAREVEITLAALLQRLRFTATTLPSPSPRLTLGFAGPLTLDVKPVARGQRSRGGDRGDQAAARGNAAPNLPGVRPALPSHPPATASGSG